MNSVETAMKGSLIGSGLTAEVYHWGNDKVLKLFFDWYQPEWVRREAEIGKSVYEAGVPAPAVYEMIEDSGRSGVIFEKLAGQSMQKLLEVQPLRFIYFAKQMARIHAQLHQGQTRQLPEQKDFMMRAIQDSREILQERTESIIEYLKRLPEGSRVCHGDFHPGNIMMTEEKAYAIDWTNATYGNPLADVARTCLMMDSPFLPGDFSLRDKLLINGLKKALKNIYLREYQRITKSSRKEIKAWMLPVAAARLREKVPGEEPWLLGLIERLPAGK